MKFLSMFVLQRENSRFFGQNHNHDLLTFKESLFAGLSGRYNCISYENDHLAVRFDVNEFNFFRSQLNWTPLKNTAVDSLC